MSAPDYNELIVENLELRNCLENCANIIASEFDVSVLETGDPHDESNDDHVPNVYMRARMFLDRDNNASESREK